MLRYKLIDLKDMSIFIQELQICSHYLLDDPRRIHVYKIYHISSIGVDLHVV